MVSGTQIPVEIDAGGWRRQADSVQIGVQPLEFSCAAMGIQRSNREEQ